MEPQESSGNDDAGFDALDASKSTEEAAEEVPLRLRRAITILHLRCSRLAVVLDGAYNSLNQQATIRTAEAMGVQCVFIVDPNEEPKHAEAVKLSEKVTKGCYRWLTIRRFATAAECVRHLKEQNWHIWTTELAADAIPMDNEHKHLFDPLPQKLAVVIGKETSGVEPEFVAASDKRVYLPMYGFSESFNLSVATALVLQRMFDWYPELRGSLREDTQMFEQLKEEWVSSLSKNPTSTAKIMRALRDTEDISGLVLGDLRDEREKVAYIPRKIQRRLAQAEEDAVSSS